MYHLQHYFSAPLKSVLLKVRLQFIHISSVPQL